MGKFTKIISVATVGTLVCGIGAYAFVSNVENEWTDKLDNVYRMVTEFKTEKDLQIEDLTTNLNDLQTAYNLVKQAIPENNNASPEDIVLYIGGLEQRISDLELQLENTETSNTELVNSLNAQIESLTNEKAALTNALNTIKEVVPVEHQENISGYIVELQNEVTDLVAENEDKDQYIAHLEGLINTANSEADELETEIAELLDVDMTFKEITKNITKTVTYEQANSGAVEVTPASPQLESVTTNAEYIGKDGNVKYYVQAVTIPNSNDFTAKIYNADGTLVGEYEGSIPLIMIVSNGQLYFKAGNGANATLVVLEG